MRYAERTRSEDIRVHRPVPQRDDSDAAQAISEGRRIYLGNLSYEMRPEDITQLVAVNDAGTIENIHISIDPVSGRNPGYCFLEFGNRDAAERAMSVLDGKMLGSRAVKAKPCLPKGQRRQPMGGEGEKGSGSGSGFNRWGDWNSSRFVRTLGGKLAPE